MRRSRILRFPVYLRLLAPILLFIAPGMASAQTVTGPFMQQALEQQGLGGEKLPSGWSITVGGALAAAPRYPGASSKRARFAPLVSLVYDRRVFLGPLGVGAIAVHWKGFRAGPLIGLQGGRQPSDDPHLTGLGDISRSVTAGAFAGYRIGFATVSAIVRQAISHSQNGLSGLFQVNLHGAFLHRRVLLLVGPDAEYGNSDYMRTWFGVSTTQSSSSGLPAYVTHAGIASVGLHAGLTYRATRHWFWRVFMGVRKLTGVAGASPIVERRTQVLAGAGIAYHF